LWSSTSTIINALETTSTMVKSRITA
jgi:hypothetical protein